ncbi:MAG: DUF5331 domain-containing protein [Elainellaceae cyanobacterium]
MNTEQFRQSLKLKWLKYYRDNQSWLEQLGVWVSYEGQRRPSSSFILATVSVLEPRLCQMMPIVVGLSSNPDRVVKAMGLNFSPVEELKKAIASGLLSAQAEEVKRLPAGRKAVNPAMSPAVDVEHSTEAAPTAADAYPIDAVDLYLDQKRSPHQVAAAQDAACHGVGGRESSQAPERGRLQNAATSHEAPTPPISTQPISTQPLIIHGQPDEMAIAMPQAEEAKSESIQQQEGEPHDGSLESRDLEQNDNSQGEPQGESEANQSEANQSEANQSEAIAASFGKNFSPDAAIEARDTSPEALASPAISPKELQSSNAYSF